MTPALLQKVAGHDEQQRQRIWVRRRSLDQAVDVVHSLVFERLKNSLRFSR